MLGKNSRTPKRARGAGSRRTSPRRQPTQARARVTVDAILEAAAHLLVSSGYARLTTNHVAERAGVSIGSVYMYFRSKEGIVAALIERHLERFAAAMFGEMALARREPLAAGIERIVTVLVRTTGSVAPKLHLALQQQVPRVGAFEKIRDLDRAFAAHLQAALDARPDEHALPDTGLAAFMTVHALKAITLTAIRDRPDALADGRLARELARMAVPYLTGRR